MRSRQIHNIIPMIAFLLNFYFLPPFLNAYQNSAVIDSLLAKGDLLLNQKRFEEARAAYQAALKIDKNLIRAYSGLGKVAIAEEKWATAGDEFQNVLVQDSENIEAHYYRGICTRETGKYKALILRKLDWDKSKKHFQKVIAKDSLYRDVIYQFARLQRYRENYTEAIQLGHIQIRLKPELVEPQVKLFRFYRYFITHTKRDETINWLKQQPWHPAKWAIGEKFRREGQLSEADSVLQDLLTRPLTMPRQPIYLSLVRIYYKKNLPEKAEKYYWQAINETKSEVDADLVFEDVKYIITDQELETYRLLKSSDEKIQFFRTLWVSRDPTPAASINHRLAEHYRRLLVAEKNYEFDDFRTWFNNPDKFGYLEFTKTYDLNHEFNDKGLIYIRHGPYDDWAMTAGSDIQSNESWVYYQTQATPKMVFHFFLENTVGYWRFTPIIIHPLMLEDRVQFGNIYHRLLRADPLERLAYTEEMARESREYVATGLTTDRHTWEKKIEPLETPFSISTFRGSEGKTILEIYYAFSLVILANEEKYKDQKIEIEKGLTIHNQWWRQIEKTQEKVLVPVKKSESYIDLYRFEVDPDSYHVAFYLRPLGTDLLGGWKYGKQVPDYSSSKLSLSDIQLATYIEVATAPTKFEKNGLNVIPNPTRLFSRNEPVYIYFEIYHLTQDSNARTSFSIEYTLTLLEQKKKGFLALFRGGGKSSITTRIDREGKGELSVEYLAIDVGQLKAGEYELAIRVTDEHSGTTAIQTRGLALK